jgi:arginyl-tRNA synthetase
MNIISILQNNVAKAVKDLYDFDIAPQDVICSPTRKEFEGDYTITVFAFAKAAKKSPVQVGEEMGQFLSQNLPFGEAGTEGVSKFNVIQGFLNLVLDDAFWFNYFAQILDNQHFGDLPKRGEKVMVEYSSPNTNKPLHLGHIRNILLGWSASKILAAAGYDVVRTKVVNDRGIAICKSMLAWQLYGQGKTPQSVEARNPDGTIGKGVKGDHFVGDYYVLFEQKFQEEYKPWQATEEAQQHFNQRKKVETSEIEFFKEYKNEYFNKYSKLGAQAREMLLKWESGDIATVDLWKTMNGWVYEGFDETYDKLGVSFDRKYYESNTYMLGKDIIEDGLSKNIFYQKPDTSVWIDLTDVKLDHKLVLRSDGTSVYMTQDIGMARLRDHDFHCQKVVYVVADEQNYHFQVLFEIMKKLGEPYANGLYHLSYGMVELPTGKMKSREGTVVDADDLVAEVVKEATREVKERNSIIAEMPEPQRIEATRRIGIGAMKYDLIKVNPKKRMVFDPAESVSFEGHTGPYIQYAYVRSSGVVRDSEYQDLTQKVTPSVLEQPEKELILKFYEYERIIEEAAQNYDPSVIANYSYDLAKTFNRFWQHCPILKSKENDIKIFRLQLSKMTAHVLQHSMGLLGIEMPERM